MKKKRLHSVLFALHREEQAVYPTAAEHGDEGGNEGGVRGYRSVVALGPAVGRGV